eukprot:GHVU01154579.1.p1 GENE.GHVU01154579.1~~GHVU01154579.1.p1  ORF type:complete len:100 (+),score=15.46 GHVU01154579.1:173-472(+)
MRMSTSVKIYQSSKDRKFESCGSSVKTSSPRDEARTPQEVPIQMKMLYDTRKLIKEEVEAMLEPSISPYGAAVILVKKKDGSNRFCIDETSSASLILSP